MLDPARALLRGIPTKVADAVNATGNNQSRGFSAVKGPFAASIRFQAIGTFSALSGNIESSVNGGTNWATFQAFDLASATPVNLPAISGLLYRLTFGTVTQTVPPDVYAILE